MFHAQETGIASSRNFKVKLPPLQNLTEGNLEKFDEMMDKFEQEFTREQKRRIKEEAIK